MAKAHIQFAGMNINYITEKIDVKKSLNHRNSSFIGQDGSDVSFVSSDARVLSFNSLCLRDEESAHGNGHRINDYINLASIYKSKSGALQSNSSSNLKGEYMITGFNYSESTNGDYEISWEFTEKIPFNITQKTFRVWNKAQAGKTKTKSKTTKKSSLNSNLKYLLKNCGVMKRNDSKKGIKCVKCLQIYLQSQGYYKNYKLDGWFSKYTEAAVKGLQKKYKLKTSGVWDKATIKYFQKKYKYPTDLIDKSTKQLSKIKGPIRRTPRG